MSESLEQDHQILTTAHCGVGVGVGGQKGRLLYSSTCCNRWYHFYNFTKRNPTQRRGIPAPRTSPRTFLPQEETLCPYSAAQRPARGSCLPNSQPQPSTCLPSWRPGPTSGLPACAKPTGPTAGSHSSLKPPVSERASRGAGGPSSPRARQASV